ncbi:hypothetical protein JL108_08700 [Aeromicrobium sp. YIM 150415]|uniref:hypothetical protein n=1 Tax=Aeromicrobium sp. YIM 150415 TaxID=2803912 RepID=UPI00196429A3|nr:hypothetical protein [Aeromicrobium sp. YIM 150415]MBM9463529.1 hypothetical protein [Aeromicrobium sp. YIM 150415]
MLKHSPGAPCLILGRRTADALASAGKWRHRKVESLRMFGGDRGRRKVSIDCTPPRVTCGHSGATDVVPLGLIRKRPMKHFDLVDASGTPLPVLGRADDGHITWSALCYLFSRDLERRLSRSEQEVLRTAVFAPRERGRELAVAAMQTFPDRHKISDQAFGLLYDTSTHFVLYCLAPRKRPNTRRIFKYSYAWNLLPGTVKARWFQRILIAAGYSPAVFDLDIAGASDVASYHLEVHVSEGLQAAGLELPEGADHESGRVDPGGGSVAHAVASYSSQEADRTWKAVFAMKVEWRGVRTNSLVVTLFTFMVFLLHQILPGADQALKDAGDGAVAVLLVVPAAYGIFGARAGESAVLSSLVLPLRAAMLTCSALLVAIAASIVGALREPYLGCLWLIGFIVVSLMAALQAGPLLVSARRYLSARPALKGLWSIQKRAKLRKHRRNDGQIAR